MSDRSNDFSLVETIFYTDAFSQLSEEIQANVRLTILKKITKHIKEKKELFENNRRFKTIHEVLKIIFGESNVQSTVTKIEQGSDFEVTLDGV